MERLLVRSGLRTAALPISMAAAAIAGLLLLATMGLSLRDWRAIGAGAGRGATRLAELSGSGSAEANSLLAWFWRRRQKSRLARDPETDRRSDSHQARHPPVVTPLPSRREPRLSQARDRGGLVRFIAPAPRPSAPGKRSEGERQPALDLEPEQQPILPSLELLVKPPVAKAEAINEEALEKNARLLETVLEDFGVRGQIVQVRPGPVVTLYEFEPAPGIKASRIIGLADDIARSMSAISVRVAVVSGRNVIGIELPNRKAETVFLRELLDLPVYESHPGRLALILGKDISGEPVLADLAKMPHLLIAGTTGSGKSVGINTMILSVLYRMPPDRCKFIMIDPKMLELSVYDGIPHLLAPVVTDPRKAVLALKWDGAGDGEPLPQDVEARRAQHRRVQRPLGRCRGQGRERDPGGADGVRPGDGSSRFSSRTFDTSQLPLIVVVVDEMADPMMVAGKEIEAAIQRLAQMARAAGIHLIMAAEERSSVDVITGTIKANFPTRISLSGDVENRQPHDPPARGGAEQLLGRGDLLYMAGAAGALPGSTARSSPTKRSSALSRSCENPGYRTTSTRSPRMTIRRWIR